MNRSANNSTNSPSRLQAMSPLRARKPSRPLPGLPVILDTSLPPGSPPPPRPSPSYLTNEDYHQPYQLLEAHPLSLLCTFHNVKRVSLEAGVPPPLRLDVPIMASALEKPDPLLPTHILAVYDQDAVPEQSHSGAPESPFSAYVPGPDDPPSLPSTPIMIPINADLWTTHLSMSIFSPSQRPHSEVIPSPTSVAQRRTSLLSTHSISPRSSRILSLPIIVLRVPNASVLPLLLLASLEVLPINSVAPALLPLQVLNELPAAPAMLALSLLRWLRPHEVPTARRDEAVEGRRVPIGFKKRRDTPDRRVSSSSEASRSELDIGDQVSGAFSRLSIASTSTVPPSPASYRSSVHSFSSASSSAPHMPPQSQPSPILDGPPICALTDPATASDPDMRLLLLAQQNFGLWANSLALGTNARVTHLVELAWSVAAEARRLRFGDIASRQNESTSRSRPPMSRRHRSRTPVPVERQTS
ncbi:hypothetical protein SCHPADRAFT_932173 [Schizopora paradoxa]|uniref:Uncharacterized protein n=1 Tax=Schizopora paradoxa TaxID=27342 RepID=A0A0H2RE74_9AGAM|nr:hypothetical protein SCHPADRAFT_932173 [Schizopora paradoxa]